MKNENLGLEEYENESYKVNFGAGCYKNDCIKNKVNVNGKNGEIVEKEKNYLEYKPYKSYQSNNLNEDNKKLDVNEFMMALVEEDKSTKKQKEKSFNNINKSNAFNSMPKNKSHNNFTFSSQHSKIKCQKIKSFTIQKQDSLSDKIKLNLDQKEKLFGIFGKNVLNLRLKDVINKIIELYKENKEIKKEINEKLSENNSFDNYKIDNEKLTKQNNYLKNNIINLIKYEGNLMKYNYKNLEEIHKLIQRTEN